MPRLRRHVVLVRQRAPSFRRVFAWHLGCTLAYMENQSKELKKACELLQDFRTGMLVTRDDQGGMHARPMMVAEVDAHLNISFITRLESEKVSELLRAPQVGVTLQHGGAFVAVAGLAKVIVDPAEKERVWSRANNIWFEGPDDPSAALISIVPQSIEYWDNRGLSSLKFVFQALVAKARGDDPETDSRQHAFIDMQP